VAVVNPPGWPIVETCLLPKCMQLGPVRVGKGHNMKPKAWILTSMVILAELATAAQGLAQEAQVDVVTGTPTFTNLVTFDGSDGQFPENAPLVQGPDGNLYGTTNKGGITSTSCGASNSCGTVFKITPNGTLTTLYKFCSQPNCSDGFSPFAGLTLATDGDLYGTTPGGGANGGGTAFRITPAGKRTTIYDFCSGRNCPDGGGPFAGLVQATDGNLYGTNYGGIYGAGTVFKLTPAGKLTTLYSFCAQLNCPDGQYPTAPLIQGADGNLYGTTVGGGTGGNGTVFKINP